MSALRARTNHPGASRHPSSFEEGSDKISLPQQLHLALHPQQLLGELLREIDQQTGAQAVVEAVERDLVAGRIDDRPDVRRAPLAVDHGHLAERHARTERRQALLEAAVDLE